MKKILINLIEEQQKLFALDTRIRNALSIIGKYNSDKKNISIKHDEYLKEYLSKDDYKK
ncbi:hypothetical protein LLG07_07560 [bacterium]|nr:hypothetical protein [bacterium]